MRQLCSLDAIPAGGGLEVVVAGPEGPVYLLVFSPGGLVRAYQNACPHQGRNLAFAPNEFLFDPTGKLICPHHGAAFDIATGECVEGPCKGAFLTPVKIVVSEGTVFVVSEGGETGDGRR